MASGWSESKINRDRKTGRFTDKPTVGVPQAPPTRTPDDDNPYASKIDQRLRGKSLQDFETEQPVLIVTMGEGRQYVARAHADEDRQTVYLPVNDNGMSCSVDVFTYGSFNETTPSVPNRIISIREGTQQDLYNSQRAHQILENEAGRRYDYPSNREDKWKTKGVNFKEEGPKARAKRMQAVFNQLKDAGYIPEGVTATFHARDWRKTHDRFSATDVTYTAPKGTFYAVPTSMNEIYDRAEAGDDAADNLRIRLSMMGKSTDHEANPYLAERAREGDERFMLPTEARERMSRINAELDESFSMDDEYYNKLGGIAARFEEV